MGRQRLEPNSDRVNVGFCLPGSLSKRLTRALNRHKVTNKSGKFFRPLVEYFLALDQRDQREILDGKG